MSAARGRGRPPRADATSTRRRHILLTPTEDADILRRADAVGVDVSTYIRAALEIARDSPEWERIARIAAR